MAIPLGDGPLKGWKVLVVDDEPDNAEVAKLLLELHGASVLTADNGQEALELAKHYLPNFILADLSMPVMSGWALLHELRQDSNTSDIPVIALTAHAMAGDRERVLNAGFHTYISKPIEPETFVSELVTSLAEIPKYARILRSEVTSGKEDRTW